MSKVRQGAITSQPGQDVSIAVALRYGEEDGAPMVVASGRGAVADRIIETAQAAGVAIDENPMLASALESVPLDETIPQELYEAVAEVIGWVLRADPSARKSRSLPTSGDDSALT